MPRRRQAEFLVTGGAGFIGSNVVRRLAAEGRSVRVLDDFSTGRAENIRDLGENVEFIEGDITDERVVRAAVAGARHVLHLAAVPSVSRSVEDPATTNRVNVCGTLRLLLAARDAGVKRFVFSSSSSVYGDTPELPKREDMTPMPLSPYAAQKLTGEHYCRVFQRLYRLPTFILRYFNVYGPRQNPRSQYAAVIPLFVEAFRKGRSPVIYGDGEQTRDFTFVDDVVRANLLCCAAPARLAGVAYNICGGTRTTVNRLAAALGGLTGSRSKPVHRAARPGDIRHSQGDGARARKALGWLAGVGLEEGLCRTVDFFLRAGRGPRERR
jgi:nucleoside-diphosphate-sugar epimerase